MEENKMKERERCKRLLMLLQKLMNERDLESFQLLETMVKKDTLAMQESFKVIAENRLGWVEDFTKPNIKDSH